MNKKTITLVGLLVALVAVAFAAYNSFSQLKDIDYDLFDTEEDENED
jgi:hypothetical protein